MAEKKSALLKGMLNHTARPAQPPQPAQQADPTPRQDIVRGTPYRTGFQESEVQLPPEASHLSAPLQDYARRYLGARRRSGEALLEAARWLTEARDAAQHGEWLQFLDITATTPDTAERLLNIHRRAMGDPSFADAIRTNWLAPSAAALLASPSTPPEVVAEVLSAPEPPKVAEVKDKIKQARQPRPEPADQAGEAEQIPQVAASAQPEADQPISTLEMFRETINVLEHLRRSASELPDTNEVRQGIERAKIAISAIQRTVEMKG